MHIRFTLQSRFHSFEVPILSLPRICYETIRNFFQAGWFKIVSLQLQLRNEGLLTVHGRLLVNLFTNTLNSSPHESTVILISPTGKFTVEGQVAISNGGKITVSGTLLIQDGTYLNARTSIVCLDQITIGKHCAISWDVSIIDSNVHELSVLHKPRNIMAPIIIEDHVWIGAHAKILKGVRIGAGAVVAAGSIVTHDVLPGTLVAGSPAKQIQTNVTWA